MTHAAPLSSPTPHALAAVAHEALSLVTSGMVLGLGSGRAAHAFVRMLGERVRAGLDVRGVPTSQATEALAREVGVPLVELGEVPSLELAFDGADEVAPNLDLVKGLGGALVRERIVAAEARRFVVLVTPDKLVERLGDRCALPVEVVPFALPTVARRLRSMGARVTRRAAGEAPFVSDNGNAILDCGFGPVTDAAGLERTLRAIPGVVDTGFFLAMATLVLVGDESGVRKLGVASRPEPQAG